MPDRYCLDANVFIQAKNGPYGLDFHPSFWRWMEDAMGDGLLYTSSEVYDEIMRGRDDLSDWFKNRKGLGAFVVPNIDTQTIFAEIGAYIQKNYESKYVAEFLSVADPWIIAQAAVDGSIVVTHEKAVGSNAKKIKIPNICIEFDVAYMDCYEMLRCVGARF